MTDDHAARVHATVLETVTLATDYFRDTGRVPDEEDVDRLANAFNDAYRGLGVQITDGPPEWLSVIGGLLHAMLCNIRYLRFASEEPVDLSPPKNSRKGRRC